MGNYHRPNHKVNSIVIPITSQPITTKVPPEIMSLIRLDIEKLNYNEAIEVIGMLNRFRQERWGNGK